MTEWLPLLDRNDIRDAVVYELKIALKRCAASLAAYVIKPDHIHLLVYLPSPDTSHAFCKCWRARLARKIVDILPPSNDADSLRVLAEHAEARCQYATWTEQARSLPIQSWQRLGAEIDYIHVNPVKRPLVQEPAQWPHSSYGFYEFRTTGILPITPPEP